MEHVKYQHPFDFYRYLFIKSNESHLDYPNFAKLGLRLRAT